MFRKRDLYLVALSWKMICNLGDPMSPRHPVIHAVTQLIHICDMTRGLCYVDVFSDSDLFQPFNKGRVLNPHENLQFWQIAQPLSNM